MDSNCKSPRVTPKKCSKNSENSNPNVEHSPGFSKSSKSPSMAKSATKTQKSVSRNPNTNQLASPSAKNKIRQRKFVIAKRNKSDTEYLNSTMVCKCNNKAGSEKKKCLCVAYETLRASQEEFFKNRCGNEQEEYETEKLDEVNAAANGDGERITGHMLSLTTVEQEVTLPVSFSEGELVDFSDCCATDELPERENKEVGSGELSGGTIKRRRERLLEKARQNVPEAGSGKVKHLVKAFEKLLSIPKTNECEEKGGKTEKEEEEDYSKGLKWALPGLQPTKIPETQVSSSSFCPSDFFLTSESFGLDSRRASSLDSSHGCFSISSRTSGGGRRSRRNSAESSGTFAMRKWKRRQLKVTSQKPFKLRTEERGKCKEEDFLKKMQQMAEEEEKQRIPIAQGLPWTTDEPECLPKPPVKESTRPVDLMLHSDIRAVERAEFDHQVAEKLSLIEQYKMERERLQKMAEEGEIRRLRKELVPKAQPMPYFDRPFIPRRSTKDPTIPREPKFHIPQHKKIKCCMSWNDMYIHNNSEWGMQQ